MIPDSITNFVGNLIIFIYTSNFHIIHFTLYNYTVGNEFAGKQTKSCHFGW